ncbi:MAG: V-type ATPase subunit [Eubacteriales bacterium]|nr:V-type ATPase subunit [Eubacteriales bacterium]
MSVISYSGIAAKIRAMKAELLTESDFEKLESCRLSVQKAEFLAGFRPYAALFRNASDENLHRAGLERRLRLSLFQDFDKLYRFGNVRQKHFLKLYFAYYEVQMVKECLQAVLSGRPSQFELALYEDFIKKYAKIDLIRLGESKNLTEFIENLAGTPYYSILKRLEESGHAGTLDYETAIDMRYFMSMWRRKKKELSPAEEKMIERTFGSRIDMLNLNWIYRSKKYYHLTPEELYALLIPIRYQISAQEMKKMVEAPGLQEFIELERATCYGPMVRAYLEKQGGTFADAQGALLLHLYEREARQHPYSIAPIHSYFFLKEREIERIIYIVERSHYTDSREQGTEKGVLS